MLIQFLWFHDHEGHDVNTEEKNILFDVRINFLLIAFIGLYCFI